MLGTEDAEEAAGMLLDRGVSLVLVSMGREGALYAGRDFVGGLLRFQIDTVVDRPARETRSSPSP